MRILLVSQHYPPEVTAGANRVHAFAAGLARLGHGVEVLCSVPNHPSGQIPAEFRGRAVHRALEDGVEVTRTWMYARPEKSVRQRIAGYGSFAGMAAGVGARSARPDLILTSSPPLPVAASAALLARRFRVPWVMDVRDLWPDIAVALNQLSEGRPLELARRLERRLYRDADRIVAVTEPFRGHIEARGGAGKVDVIYNGTDEEFIESAETEPDRGPLGIPEDRFVWTYPGNIGLAQGLDIAIEAAGILGEGFELVLLGDGPLRDELIELAGRTPNAGVSAHEAVPPAEAAVRMRASDALLVPQAPHPELAAYVPSKLFDCCAVGRPVVVAAAGETLRLVEENGAALTVTPGDADGLAAAIRSLRDQPELGAALSEHGRSFAAKHRRSRDADRLEAVLREVAAGGS